MRISVIGAGSIGATIAHELHAIPEVDLVQVCDARARSLQALQDGLSSPRLRSFQIDARDLFVLKTIIEHSDVVIGAAPTGKNAALAELCVDLGIHYCDLGGADPVVESLLRLDASARAQNVWVVPNCGLAPGLINVLCLHGLDQFDEVEAAQLRVGDIPLDPTPPFNFTVSWSPEKIIEDYTNPVQLIEDGEVTTHAPLSHLEHLYFAPPFGELEAFCTQGGLSTLARSLEGKVPHLDHKTIRWPGHAAQMQFLLALGFGEAQTIDVRTHLTYRDVLVRKMRQRLGSEQPDVLLMRVLVRGKKNGVEKTLLYETIEEYDAEDKTTAMRRATAIPTVVLALRLARGEVPGGGAAPPEYVVDRGAYLDAIRERGIGIRERWFDGYVSVTDAMLAQASQEEVG